MRAVVQRVKSSKVVVDERTTGEIGVGLNVLLGISEGDDEKDIKYLKEKIVNLRIFEDEDGKMNKSLLDIGGELLVISQFTLYGDCRKGRRPNFMRALGGKEAEVLYEKFVDACKEVVNVETGEFGADMDVFIQNDGPVTLLLESNKDF